MIGKILGDRYEILELVGEGGMARVYKARCNMLNRNVAVKILRDEFADDEGFVKKFRRESQAAASLSHPNILNIYDVGVDNLDGKDIHYIVMELIEGKTLKEYIKKKGKLSPDETIEFSIQIAEALKNAHENGIVHRDIKPQNIMVTLDHRIKVTDFGIARAATSATLTTTSSALGSVHYFSPEQARGGYTDEKSDIYSLGIVMYEMVTGKLPFDGETPIAVALKHVQEEVTSPLEIEEDIPKALELIIMKCVAKHQSDRYEDAEQVIIALNHIQKDGDVKLVSQDTMPIDDEFATQVIPNIDDEMEESYADRAKKSKKKPKEKEKKKASNFKVTALAILLAFIVVTGGFFGLRKIKSMFPEKGDIEVPDLLGMEIEQAESSLEELGLKLKIKGKTSDDKYDPGQIVSQNPKEGSKVKEGFTIEVMINDEDDEMVRVPALVDKSLDQIQELLNEADLLIGDVKYRESDTVDKDIVIEQHPQAYTNVESGSKVDIIVSEGKATKKVVMPKVTEKNIVDAKNKLYELNLEVKVIEEFSEEFEQGIVMWQSVKTESEIEQGSSVTLHVSKGPKESEKTEESPKTEEPGESAPIPAPQETSMTITVSPFTDKDNTQIKIIRRQDGQSQEVYNQSHAAGSDVNIPVKGKSGSEFEVYLDGIYQFTRRKDN